MKPNFIIPGASRSGTTTLYHFLTQHPNIYMPSKKKELSFFEKEVNYERGNEFYESFFQVNDDRKMAFGESSPPYFHKGIKVGVSGEHVFDDNNDAPNRLYKYNPDVKLIFTLRNPISRLLSQYWKNVNSGTEKSYLFEALKQELNGDRNPEVTTNCWMYKNSYSIHLNHWFSIFPKDNIKVFIFEDWINNLDKLMQEIEQFLNLPHAKISFNYPHSNKGIGAPRNIGIHKYMREKFRDGIIKYLVNKLNVRDYYP